MLNYKLRVLTQNIFRMSRSNRIHSTCKYGTKTINSSRADDSEENDVPIKYSASPAVSYKAARSRQGSDPTKRPSHEPMVVIISFSIFLFYFAVLREENDLDDELRKSLYERIDGLEEASLKVNLDYNHQHGMDTSNIEKRLSEIQEKKAEV